MIKEEMHEHEEKITNEIKENKGSKKVWNEINKLKGNKHKETKEQILYNEDGQKLSQEEASATIEKHWEKIYKKQENKIRMVWTEHKEEYISKYVKQGCKAILKEEQTAFYIPDALREHYELCFQTTEERAMNYPTFTVEEVQRTLQRLKGRKASGPDNLKPELYKGLKDSQPCLQALTNCFQKILDEEQKVKEWEISITNMIPKTNRPTAGQLRPIVLTDITTSYL